MVVLSRGYHSLLGNKEWRNSAKVNTTDAIVYNDTIVASVNGTLELMAINGTIFKSKEDYSFSRMKLKVWTLIPTGKYLL